MVVVLKSFFVFIIAFLITFYLVPLFIRVALKFGIMDNPDGKLKLQKVPTPYLGGLAIYLGFIVAVCLELPFEQRFFLFILASTILLFLGLLDDLIALSPGQKFFGQCIATLIYLKAGFYLKALFFGNAFNIAISALWFLTLINAFNLVDVMDGLATTIALSIAVIYTIFALLLGQWAVVWLLLGFAGSLLAFLWFNRPQARIYLGDSGSLFIGGFIACIPFTLSWSELNSLGYLIPLIVCAIPLLECSTLIVVRTYLKQPFYYGSPHHFSCLLRHAGWRVSGILWYSAGMTFFAGFASILFFYNVLSIGPMLILAGLFLSIWFYLLCNN